MTEHIEPTARMVAEALKAGRESGLLRADATDEQVKAFLATVMAVMPRHYSGPRYPFEIRNPYQSGPARFGITKVRIVSTDVQPGYFRIEREDGRTMSVHGNEFVPQREPDTKPTRRILTSSRKGAFK